MKSKRTKITRASRASRAKTNGAGQSPPPQNADSKPSAAKSEKPPSTDAELIAKYGDAIFLNEKGEIKGINERFFAARFHRDGRTLFEPGEKSFYEYSPETGLWRRVGIDHVREKISAHILQFGREKAIELEPKITTSAMGGVMAALRGIAAKPDVFNSRRDFIHVANGVIRFGVNGELELTGFRPEDYSRNRCEYPFIQTAQCSEFLRYLKSALPNDDIDYVQKWMGLAVAGTNPTQCFVILEGKPKTGKSTLVEIGRGLVGAQNTVQLRTSLLNKRFETFRFAGKTLLVAADVPGDFLNSASASTLKSLVGGDFLTAEAKGSNEVFAIVGNFNVLITANSRLHVRVDGDAGAWGRRLKLIRFDRPPSPKLIPNFAEKLLEMEGPGILRWCLEGLVKARKEIQETGTIKLSDAHQARIDALILESEAIRRFVLDCLERGKGDVSSVEIVEAYYAFCAARAWKPQPIRIVENALPDLMLEIFGASKCHCVVRKGKQARGWPGVRLKSGGNGK